MSSGTYLLLRKTENQTCKFRISQKVVSNFNKNQEGKEDKECVCVGGQSFTYASRRRLNWWGDVSENKPYAMVPGRGKTKVIPFLAFWRNSREDNKAGVIWTRRVAGNYLRKVERDCITWGLVGNNIDLDVTLNEMKSIGQFCTKKGHCGY